MSWYPTRSEIADAEARLVQSRSAAHSGVQHLRSTVRAQFGRPAFLLGTAAVALLIGMLIARRRLLTRALTAPASALGQIGKALLISFGTRSFTRLLLQRRRARTARTRQSDAAATMGARERVTVRTAHSHTHH